MTFKNHSLRVAVSTALALGMAAAAMANDSLEQIPLTSDHWQPHGAVSFVQKEAFPQGLMVISGANDHDEPLARLKGVSFDSGTIEFDVKPSNDEWPTVHFRVHGEREAEEFYIRPGADCAVAIDCLQYAPKVRGRMLWDTYYHYQSAAPFRDNEWNHVRLVISGRRMNVYINRNAQPSLMVDELAGEGGAGAVELQGPATFANVVVAPGVTDGLSPQALTDPTRSDHGYLRHWQLASSLAEVGNDAPDVAQLPGVQAAWRPINAERLGLVNLARRFDPTVPHSAPQYAWLQTTISSDRDRVEQVQLAYLREARVFVNDKLVFSGENLYNTPKQRKAPDGRLGLANGAFALPLQKGINRIVVALRSNTPDMSDHYSYGFRFHIEQAKGLSTGE